MTANTNELAPPVRSTQHRKRTILQRLTNKAADRFNRQMTGLETFLCGCAAGIMLAALIVTAIAH